MEHVQGAWSSSELPGLNCGLCGFRLCSEFAVRLEDNPALVERCIHLTGNTMPGRQVPSACGDSTTACGACGSSATHVVPNAAAATVWRDSLDREFDFYLEHFPEEPGPREIILPHNPLICRELELAPGDIVVGRPLGMSCGCPITHCGVIMEVDPRTGVMVWCVTGPLGPREKGFKDLGYYSAEGYEGMISQARLEIRIGMRYYFQPSMCMLQWRHSGLVNFINRTPAGIQVRLEGLWIG
ncbi:MAG TPA: (Fe-S)-binding protein [Geobacteraceae bacterium]